MTPKYSIIQRLQHFLTKLELKGRQASLRYKAWITQPHVKRLIKIGSTAAVLIGFIGTVIGLWADVTGKAVFPTLTQETRMTGDFRVGVTALVPQEPTISPAVGRDLAQGIYSLMSQTGAESQTDFTITIWGPDRLPPITGQTAAARATAAADLAADIDADMIVYGAITHHDGKWQITPEFYVREQSFLEAAELTGHHQLGAAFSVPAQANLVSRITVSREYASRAQALTFLTVGLGFYAVNRYADSLTYFQYAENVENWQEDTGKEVLYLLMGNAEMKQEHLSAAESHYRHALNLDPDYARAYVGLASVYYLNALMPARAGSHPADVDLRLINRAIRTYQRALDAPNQPPTANIVTKVHLGLGQSYLSRQYAHYQPGICAPPDDFILAITELEQVVAAYTNPEQADNSLLREFAAEAYGRLGLIYYLSCNKLLAVQNYEMAVALSTDPERRGYFQSSLASLQE